MPLGATIGGFVTLKGKNIEVTTFQDVQKSARSKKSQSRGTLFRGLEELSRPLKPIGLSHWSFVRPELSSKTVRPELVEGRYRKGATGLLRFALRQAQDERFCCTP